METQTFLDLIWSTGTHDSITALYNKAHEVLQTSLLGLGQLEPQYDYVGPALARSIMPDVTEQRVRHFLLTKSVYAVDLRPTRRTTWTWSTIQNRYVKWQADLADLRNLNMGVPYALTIVDTFSKFAFVLPMPDKTGPTTARLFDALFSRRPILESPVSQFKPQLLLTDRGSEFTSKQTYSVCKFHRVFQIFTFSYTPLGMIERFNQTLKRKLRKVIAKGRMQPSNFADTLQSVVRDYNYSIHSTTKQRPIVLHFIKQQPFRDRILYNVRLRIQAIRRRAQAKASTPLTPLESGVVVRALSLKNPLLTRQQRAQLKKKMEYKKFGHSYWTKEHFVIQQRNDANGTYLLKDYPNEKYRREELQRVVR